ncbi:hypothetical protein E2C01_087126 [Portunus trituberculatus]|uniref:Uncharacterized protein n=1 Tax=Portunus trituberculatus TaxID=210409 RepID=A0A5B7JI80_PORTR|nr:hypothetical protein [Portunus trituberculatus]
MTTIGYRMRARPNPRRRAFLDSNDDNNNIRTRGSRFFKKKQSKHVTWRLPPHGQYLVDPSVYTVEADYRRSYGKVSSRDWEGYEAMLQRQLG